MWSLWFMLSFVKWMHNNVICFNNWCFADFGEHLSCFFSAKVYVCILGLIVFSIGINSNFFRLIAWHNFVKFVNFSLFEFLLSGEHVSFLLVFCGYQFSFDILETGHFIWQVLAHIWKSVLHKLRQVLILPSSRKWLQLNWVCCFLLYNQNWLINL